MVFGYNGLASGPGNACISIELTPTYRKVKEGKCDKKIDFSRKLFNIYQR
jgi:hypothetical protein